MTATDSLMRVSIHISSHYSGSNHMIDNLISSISHQSKCTVFIYFVEVNDRALSQEIGTSDCGL